MDKVEVLVIVTVTGEDGAPVSKNFRGEGIKDCIAAVKNADQAINLIIDNENEWTENRLYQFRVQLKEYDDRVSQAMMAEVDEGRQGQEA